MGEGIRKARTHPLTWIILKQLGLTRNATDTHLEATSASSLFQLSSKLLRSGVDHMADISASWSATKEKNSIHQTIEIEMNSKLELTQFDTSHNVTIPGEKSSWERHGSSAMIQRG